ncbi:Coenzyme F420 hydrogenase/dehydrogenase, beta subunit C-terminal domain [Megamonas hypermegale]|uniref:Coenzyme F420 hydrogenase/dehydrogenase, beta subunit C-terminal domain n=1 Tax=Megamonas hypermegale TaxID=158847 RepID=UPI0026EB5CFB|nr:Coenzyme F420 hydrogenase/dehydrogenase, beta subunit C-terminal domain [Megamonas hypermegale]
MIEIKDKKDCCGCYACYNICPKQCITMKVDEEGFWYPVIEQNKCINCNLCEKICPVINPIDRNTSLKLSYAMKNKDEEIRLRSSSGGMFYLLAENIIRQNGVVYGAGFDGDFSVKHIKINKEQEIGLLQGSKYLQSSIGNTYVQVKKDLEGDKKVLFTGTPCQIEGLKNFLRKDYINLFTMDFICHGVPSPMIWKEYLNEIRDNKQGEIKTVYFRDKKLGWKLFSLKIIFEKDTYINDLNQDLYMKGFLQDLYLRPSCYNCKFKKINRLSDITVADFWGIDKVLPKMDDDKGTSLIIIHTDKGKQLFDILFDRMIVNEVNMNEALKYNLSMIKSVKYNKKRKEFFERFINEKTLTTLIFQYTKITLAKQIQQKIKFAVKNCIQLLPLGNIIWRKLYLIKNNIKK